MKPLLLAAAALLCAAAVRAEDLPPLNEPATSAELPGKFVWADLFTTDPGTAAKFYGALFGWKETSIDRGSRRYLVLANEGRPVAGVTLRPRRSSKEPGGRWVGYVSVADVPQALASATASGGQIIIPARQVARRGTLAVFADLDGAVLGLLHSDSGDPPDYLPDPGDWAWAQLFAKDSESASLRYHQLLGYDVFPDLRSGRAGAFVLASGGYARAGLAPLPARAEARPGWLGFVRVASVDASARKAVALGGRLLVDPKPGKLATRVAVVEDPVGASVGLLELDDGTDLKEVP